MDAKEFLEKYKITQNYFEKAKNKLEIDKQTNNIEFLGIDINEIIIKFPILTVEFDFINNIENENIPSYFELNIRYNKNFDIFTENFILQIKKLCPNYRKFLQFLDSNIQNHNCDYNVYIK